ncbi:MAG: cytochrome c [Defluviicoccus sp.]|nr:MAG: cytochrome c [Defluviicoccus sp.]
MRGLIRQFRVLAGIFVGVLAVVLAGSTAVRATADPGVQFDSGEQQVTLSRHALLERPDVATIHVPHDVSYRRAMTYQAVPLSALLRGLSPTTGNAPGSAPGNTSGGAIEIVASDGFVTVLPFSLVFPKDAAASQPYLAIEPTDAPWPDLPGKTQSAGPFYVVWLHPEASGVRSEQWPYMVVRIRGTELPEQRWPELAVSPSLPAESPIRIGQTLFLTQCLVCHSLNGAGNAHMGPDLNLPQNPTEYFAPKALHQLIRNPASVRHWPDMQMQGFDEDALSDPEIDLIIRYLAHMADQKTNGEPGRE